MSRLLFTGERLHDGDPLFAVDLARHHAAYEYARQQIRERRPDRVLDLGCGTGYGTASLAGEDAMLVGIDRIQPEEENRATAALFARADLRGLPLLARSFELVVSFQVIEHLEDPTVYLDAIAGLVREDGLAILTTPNRTMSDGVNPYHVHEYTGRELDATLRAHFEDVVVHGLGMSEPVRRYMAARSARIQRIMRLDPLRLRDRLPRSLIERLFAAFAVLVRRRAGGGDGPPEATTADFPVEPLREDCIDLLAVCRRPR